MIAYISYNARYVKYRGVENVSFPESGLFPRPAGLHPSVIPYDSTFAFFHIFVSHLYFDAATFYGFTNYKAAQSATAMCAYILFFQILFLYCYKFCGHSDLFIFLRTTIARTISNRWPDHSLSFHYLYKYIYKNTADDMSALWTRHRRYRSILWVFLCGSGISVSSIRIRLHCKHGSIQPDAILSRALKGFHGRGRKLLIRS